MISTTVLLVTITISETVPMAMTNVVLEAGHMIKEAAIRLMIIMVHMASINSNSNLPDTELIFLFKRDHLKFCLFV